MFRKVSAKENVVGFYSTGPQIRNNDLRIYDVVARFTHKPPVFCIIDIRPNRVELPVTAYQVQQQLLPEDQVVTRTFTHIHCQMGALEAEEVGVEHLLRDINDPTVSTVASLVQGKLRSLSTLAEKLLVVRDYLRNVADGTTPPNGTILDHVQTIVSLLPNLNTHDLVQSILHKTNDMYMAIYVAALVRSVLALHDLVNNKIIYGKDEEETNPPPTAETNNNNKIQ